MKSFFRRVSRIKNGWSNRSMDFRQFDFHELIWKFERAKEGKKERIAETRNLRGTLGITYRALPIIEGEQIASHWRRFHFFFFLSLSSSSSSRFQSSIESWFFRRRVNAFDLSKNVRGIKITRKLWKQRRSMSLKRKLYFLSSISLSLFFFFFLSTLFVRLRSLNCTIVYIVIILVRRIRQVFVFGEVRGKNRENGSSTPMIMG